MQHIHDILMLDLGIAGCILKGCMIDSKQTEPFSCRKRACEAGNQLHDPAHPASFKLHARCGMHDACGCGVTGV